MHDITQRVISRRVEGSVGGLHLELNSCRETGFFRTQPVIASARDHIQLNRLHSVPQGTCWVKLQGLGRFRLSGKTL